MHLKELKLKSNNCFWASKVFKFEDIEKYPS